MKILLLVLSALLFGGCFVIDEIDQGREMMESHTPDSEKAAAEAANADGPPKSARERLNDYYAKQRAKASAPVANADPGDAVGRCRIGGNVHFTRRSDCRLRGGIFQ